MLEKRETTTVLGGMREKVGGISPRKQYCFHQKKIKKETMNSLASDVPGLSLIKASKGIEK